MWIVVLKVKSLDNHKYLVPITFPAGGNTVFGYIAFEMMSCVTVPEIEK